MSLFVLSDTHLALHDSGKSMEVFGSRWQNYIARIENNWRRLVTEDDTVIIAGDVSWAMTLEETVKDFAFLQSLPGHKLLGKGNHDFWWTTASKMNRHFKDNGFTTLNILYNNAYVAESFIVCGTRGWFYDSPESDKKVILRERQRLICSIESGLAENKEPIVFLHYPPVYANEMVPNIISVLKEYDIKRVYYGHLHGASRSLANEGEYMGINFKLISADHLGFKFWKIK